MARRKLSTNRKLVLLATADLLFAVWFWVPRSAKRRPARAIPDVRPFPTARGSGGIAPYLAEAERVSKIQGLAQFGRSLAFARSRFDNKAINRSLAPVACSLYRQSLDTLFAHTPYAEREWCWGVGGWYGLSPAEGLAATPFHNSDPRLVFDPAASTAMFAALVHAVASQLPPHQRQWGNIRQALEDLHANQTVTQPPRRPISFGDELAAVGIDPTFAQTQAEVGEFPGAAVVWEALRSVPAPA